MKPANHDLMLSLRLLEDLQGEPWASAAIRDLFVFHGRNRFHPRIEDLSAMIWTGRGARQNFARAIAVLHARGYLRWYPDGRYSVVTHDLLTSAEYRSRHPSAKWEGAVSWPA
jgi:hypothetical protein